MLGVRVRPVEHLPRCKSAPSVRTAGGRTAAECATAWGALQALKKALAPRELVRLYIRVRLSLEEAALGSPLRVALRVY